jgi:hypothetical protein
MATVLAPNRKHNGISAGVRFTAGVGQTDHPAALAYFRKAGYMILSDDSIPPDEAPTAEVPTQEVLHRMNGKPYALAEDGSIRSPFAPGEPPSDVPVASKPSPRKATARNRGRR